MALRGPDIAGLIEGGPLHGKTQKGSRLHDWATGDHEVAHILRPEDLGRFTDGHGYRSAGTGERCALYAGTGMGRSRDMRR